MNCPTDGALLLMTDRQGIEIDYCPQCRGVWLDRGELDKLIERSTAAAPTPAPAPAPAYQQQQQQGYRTDDRRREEHRRDDHRQQQPYKKKKEGFLGDLFDF